MEMWSNNTAKVRAKVDLMPDVTTGGLPASEVWPFKEPTVF